MRFSGRYKVVMAEFILVAVFMSESTPKLISTAASLLHVQSSLGYVEKCTHPDASVSERIPWNFEGDEKIWWWDPYWNFGLQRLSCLDQQLPKAYFNSCSIVVQPSLGYTENCTHFEASISEWILFAVSGRYNILMAWSMFGFFWFAALISCLDQLPRSFAVAL